MKTRVVSALMAVAVASITASAVTVDKQIPSVKAIRAIAAETSVVELPAKAANIVAEASEEIREKVAIRTVRIFLQNHHSLAPSLVGAIAASSPDVAATVAAEAIKLFPESAYSITKAAVAAAPEQAVRVAIAATSAARFKAREITAGVQRAVPQQAQHLNAVLASVAAGERVETADLAIVTVKVRIGTSTSTTPVNPNLPQLNAPEGQQQQVFSGVTQTQVTETVKDANGNDVVDENGDPVTETFIVFEVDTGNIDIPENLTGQEAENVFDIIARELDTAGKFQEAVVVEAYVN